jgi:Leucine-rich repeat (LRR) protein
MSHSGLSSAPAQELLDEILGKKKLAERLQNPEVDLLNYGERKRRSEWSQSKQLETEQFLSHGEAQRRRNRTSHQKAEWLRTTGKSRDATGKAQNLWPHHAVRVKARKTAAERASNYVEVKQKSSTLADRKSESLMRKRGLGGLRSGIPTDARPESNDGPLIPEISVSWTLPDPLPDTMDTWRGKRRRREGAERNAFIVLCGEIRKQLGTSGVDLFDEHPMHVSHDVHNIAEAVWTIEPLVRRACSKRAEAICKTYYALERIDTEHKQQLNSLEEMKVDIAKHEEKRRRALVVTKLNHEDPSMTILRQRIGDEKFSKHIGALTVALQKMRAVVIRSRGTLEILRGTILEKQEEIESDEKEAQAEAGGQQQGVVGVESMGEGSVGEQAFGEALDQLCSTMSQREHRLSDDELSLLSLHFQRKVPGVIDVEEFVRSVSSCEPARQAAVNEAYTWFTALIEHAYERLLERADGGGNCTIADLHKQIKFMYVRHLTIQAKKKLGGAASKAGDAKDVSKQETSAATAAKKYAHLLSDWLQTLPSPQVVRDAIAGGRGLELHTLIPQSSWSLYYAVLGDSIEDDGKFFAMMIAAWGVNTGKQLGKQWESTQRKQRHLGMLADGVLLAREERARHIEELRRLPELCLAGQGLTWLARVITSLQQVHMLWLDHNLLKSVPEHLAELTELNYLQLDHNMLEKLPPELRSLEKLRKLYLRHNRFSSPRFALPQDLGQLRNIIELHLGHNQLPKLPLALASMDRLRVLGLEHNRLHQLQGDVLVRLRGLQQLLLNGNELSSLPEEIGQLVKLKTLHLHENKISSLPTSTRELTELQSLTLHANCMAMSPGEGGHTDAAHGAGASSMVGAGDGGRQQGPGYLYRPGMTIGKPWPKIHAELMHLSLHDNELRCLPANYYPLRKLRVLDLRDNLFDLLPTGLSALEDCLEFDISSNAIRMPFELADILKGAPGFQKYEVAIQRHYASKGGIGQFILLGSGLPQRVWADPPPPPPTIGHMLEGIERRRKQRDAASGEKPVSMPSSPALMSSPTFARAVNHVHAAEDDLAEMSKIGIEESHQDVMLRLLAGFREDLRLPSPRELIGMARLETLKLNDNELGWFPVGLSEMWGTLRVLEMRGNALTALPPDIGQIVNLRSLDVSNNQLTTLPTSLLKLVRLDELTIVGNPFDAPLDALVETGVYLSPMEVDLARALRKLVKSMKRILTEAASDPGVDLSSFSPQPTRAALEMLYRRIALDPRSGKIRQSISERIMRDCLNGVRVDFGGSTITPAELEALINTIFRASTAPPLVRSIESAAVVHSAAVASAVGEAGSAGVTSKVAAVARGRLKRFECGDLQVNQLEMVQVLEDAMRGGGNATTAQSVQKYLRDRERAMQEVVMQSRLDQAFNIGGGGGGGGAGATQIQRTVRGFLQRRQPRVAGYSFGNSDPKVAREAQRRTAVTRTKAAERAEELERQSMKRELERNRRALKDAEKSVFEARGRAESERESKLQRQLSMKMSKVKELKGALKEATTKLELLTENQVLRGVRTEVGEGVGVAETAATRTSRKARQQQQANASQRLTSGGRAPATARPLTSKGVRGERKPQRGQRPHKARKRNMVQQELVDHRQGVEEGLAVEAAAASEASIAYVRVQPVGGSFAESFEVELAGDLPAAEQTVRKLKEAIQVEVFIPQKLQMLLFGRGGNANQTERLQDDQTLAYYAIHTGSTISLLVNGQ